MIVVNQYMINTSREHWNIIKRILRYIKGTLDVELCYRGFKFTIRDFIDLNFVNDMKKENLL